MTDGPDKDDVKRKFKEALDRKKASNTAATDHKDARSKIGNSAHGPAAAQRNFRRKSG